MAELQIQSKADLRVRRWRQGVWDLIREIGADGRWWNRLDLFKAAGAPNKNTIRGYLRCLQAAGIIATDEAGSIRLVQDLGPEAPRVRADGSIVTKGLGQDHMWRTIQMSLNGFTAADLAIGSRTEDVAVSIATAASYAQRLHLAGYLDLLFPGGPGQQAVYALRPGRLTGPRAPMILSTKIVWDPNLKKPMGVAEADEEAGHAS